MSDPFPTCWLISHVCEWGTGTRLLETEAIAQHPADWLAEKRKKFGNEWYFLCLALPITNEQYDKLK